MSRTGHKEVVVSVGRNSEKIDEGIASLIEKIWRAGIKTEESCQGTEEEGEVYIYFPTIASFLKFINIVGATSKSDMASPNSLYRRINPPYNAEGGVWRYFCNVEDYNICQPECGPNFRVGMHLYFPQTDQAEVERRLEKYLSYRK